jgi:hypothetical protein
MRSITSALITLGVSIFSIFQWSLLVVAAAGVGDCAVLTEVAAEHEKRADATATQSARQ